MQVEYDFGQVADGTMFNEETGLIEFPVPINGGDAERVGFNDDVPRLVGQQAIGAAGNNPQAGAEFQNTVIRTQPAADQVPLFLFVIPPQKAGAIAPAGYILWHGERTSIRPEPSAHQIKNQAEHRPQQDSVEWLRHVSQRFSDAGRKASARQSSDVLFH